MPDRKTDRERMTDDTVERDNLVVRDDSGLSIDDIKEQPKWIKWLLVALVLFIFLTTLYVFGKSIPWTPFTIYSYAASPAEVCPFERVDLVQDIAITSPFSTLDNISGETYWKDENGLPWGSSHFESSAINIDLPRGQYPSSTIRLAPPEPGEWYPAGTGNIEGRRFGFVRVYQHVDAETEDPITVKSWDDPTCIQQRVPSLAP